MLVENLAHFSADTRFEADLVIIGGGPAGLTVARELRGAPLRVFARWAAPLVLCARTSLGTINHTLLSIEAIRARDIPLLGVAFLGDENLDSEQIIVELGHTRRLGRLPRLERLDAAALRAGFAAAFEPRDFLGDAP